MSTKAIIGIVVAIVVIGGGAWYLTSQKSPGEGASLEGQNEQENENEGSGVFADVVGRAGSWTCSVETFIEEAPSQGTVFVANGKVRADFDSQPTTAGGTNVTSHMISVDGYVYTWSDAYPQGMKMKMPEPGSTSNTSSQGGVNPNSKVEYSCAPWTLDASKFTPPTSVTFMEIGANGMPSGMPQGVPVPN